MSNLDDKLEATSFHKRGSKPEGLNSDHTGLWSVLCNASTVASKSLRDLLKMPYNSTEKHGGPKMTKTPALTKHYTTQPGRLIPRSTTELQQAVPTDSVYTPALPFVSANMYRYLSTTWQLTQRGKTPASGTTVRAKTSNRTRL
jgi:hypothetical protein